MAAMRSLLVASLLVFSGCITGSGQLETRTIEVADFQALAVSHAANLEATRADTFSVVVTADDNLWRYVKVIRTGDTLEVGYLPNALVVMGTLRAEVTMPSASRVHLSGSAVAKLSGFEQVALPQFDLEESGASGFEGGVKADAVSVALSGSSKATVSGAASAVTIDASGASNAHLFDLPAATATVHLSGSSVGSVTASDSLDFDLSGASSLTYGGNPKLGTQNLSGSSTVLAR